MGKNLAKAPIIGIFYAALLYYLAAFFPHSETYTESLAQFEWSVSGLLMLLIVAAVCAVIYALVFSSVRKGGITLLLPLIVSAWGLQFLAPAFRQLLLGTPGLEMNDTLVLLISRCGATAVVLILSLLLYKPTGPEHTPGSAVSEPKYRLAKLGIVIRMLVLPVIFTILYYLLWYHLFWTADAAREFHGAAELEPFMKTIIDLLIYHGKEVVITLLNGLVYAVFSLILLFKLQGKRVMYIVINTLFCLTGALIYLVPDPVMPVAVQRAHLFETGALLLVYGVLSAFLLDTAFRRIDPPGPAVAKASPSATAAAKGSPAPQKPPSGAPKQHQ